MGVQRLVLTVLGIAVLAGGAFWIGEGFLEPAQERAEANKPVQTGAYQPELAECDLAEDDELPEGLDPPGVDDPLRYLRVVVLYPHVDQAPAGKLHVLDRVNGAGSGALSPVASHVEVDDEGTFVELLYKTTINFEHARLTREDETVFERITLP